MWSGKCVAKPGDARCIDRSKPIVELDPRWKKELAWGAFCIADRLNIAAVVLEVIEDAGNISVAVEIEGKSSVDEEKVIQWRNLQILFAPLSEM